METIAVTELAKLDNPKIVDVREQHEYADAHIAGVELIPLMTIPDHVATLAAEPGPVYVICHSGGRSAQATAFLAASGVDAVNVDGGMQAWIGQNLPVA